MQLDVDGDVAGFQYSSFSLISFQSVAIVAIFSWFVNARNQVLCLREISYSMYFLHVDVAIRVAIHPSDVFPSPQVDVDDLEDIAATAGINSMPTPTAWPPSPSGLQSLGSVTPSLQAVSQ